MKAIIKVSLLVLAFMAFASVAKSQNLELLPESQRDSILIAKAKEVVLKFGPGYYREYKEIIERKQVPPLGEINTTGEDAGRVSYHIIFLYDETKEQLDWDFAARVQIWEDTGEACSVVFGNGFGRIISAIQPGQEIEPVPYQQTNYRNAYKFEDSINK
jgi:hypothetical protein